MTREEIALKAMLALMTVYWDVEYEYESASDLIQSQIESAFEYADKFLEFCSKQPVAEQNICERDDFFSQFLRESIEKSIKENHLREPTKKGQV